MKFEYLVPTRIIFGNGCLDRLGEIASEYGDSALIITGKRAMGEHGYTERALQSLEEKGINRQVFDGISPNPKAHEVNNLISMVRENSHNLLIGLGGGSSIDAAKAASVGINYNSVEDIMGATLKGTYYSLPVIAIPTTSGSGAEVTKGAIITDELRNLKSGVRGCGLFPKVALLDPELTTTLPPKITAQTGFDALTHVIESYVARKSSPITDMYAEKALSLITHNLERAINDGKDIGARTSMMYASMLAGMNIANASSCLPHRLQQAIGSFIDIPHGRGLAAIYPAWIKHAYSYSEEKFEELEKILRCRIIEFIKKIGIDYNLTDLGATREDIKQFVERVTGNLENDPIPEIDRNLIETIYSESF